MDWTVAIFNINRPQAEHRAQIGDIIAFKPWGMDWTDHEKTEFIIKKFSGFTGENMMALCEPIFDANDKRKVVKKRRMKLDIDADVILREHIFDKLKNRAVSNDDGLKQMKDGVL